MDDEKNFYYQLGILGQLPSASSQEHAVKAVFSSLKLLVGPHQSGEIATFFPDWLRSRWLEFSAAVENFENKDFVELVKIVGEYTYRGAADRALRGVMGSLAEILDQVARDRFLRALPDEIATFWEQAQSCSLAATMGQYL